MVVRSCGAARASRTGRAKRTEQARIKTSELYNFFLQVEAERSAFSTECIGNNRDSECRLCRAQRLSVTPSPARPNPSFTALFYFPWRSTLDTCLCASHAGRRATRVNGVRRHDAANAQMRESARRNLGLRGSGFSAISSLLHAASAAHSPTRHELLEQLTPWLHSDGAGAITTTLLFSSQR